MRPVYRKLYSHLWRHDGFRGLSVGDRLLAIYLLSGPQTNQIGCYHFSPGLCSEDLGVPLPPLRRRLAHVLETFGWEWDQAAGLIYIPSWFDWNEPNGAKVLQGWLELVERLPSEKFRTAVRSALDRRSIDDRSTLDRRSIDDRSAFDRRSNGVRTQDQEQEQEVPPQPPLAGGRRLTAGELQRAHNHLRAIGRCPHGLEHDVGACAQMLARFWRGEPVTRAG